MISAISTLADAMIKEASKLEGLTQEELGRFTQYLDKSCFSEETPTKEEKKTYGKIKKALDENPRSRLEIAKVQKTIFEAQLNPKSNSALYHLPMDFIKASVSDYNPSAYPDPSHFFAINLANSPDPLIIKADSSISKIISDDKTFYLYGFFQDYDKPKLIGKHIENSHKKGGYPIEKIKPRGDKTVQTELPPCLVPAYLFIGNIIKNKEALVYVEEKFIQAPEGFYRAMRRDASYSAIFYLKNDTTLQIEKTVEKLTREIKNLEKLI